MISKKSQTYAQALFELEFTQEISRQLKVVSEVFMEQNIRDFFLSFTVSKKNKKQVLTSILEQTSPILKNFLFVLLDNRAFSLLPQIVFAYEELMEKKNKLCTGTIYSSQPVSDEQKKDIERRLQKFFQKEIALKQKEDKSLLAGLYIEAGGFIFDNTVKHHLKQFKTSGG